MKPFIALSVFLVLSSAQGSAQESARRVEAPLARLASLTTIPLPEWRWHDDVPHPEDPSLDDSKWELTKLGAKWSTGTRAFRQRIEIPEKINGYAVEGARLKLDLALDSNGPDEVSVFANGALVFRGNEDTLQPTLLMENVRPGQDLLIAVRMEATEVESNFYRAALTIEPPPSRPDPALLRMEILSARPLIAAYQDGQFQREQQLDAAEMAIDCSARDRGDQVAFDGS
jgi:hypothetical protein